MKNLKAIIIILAVFGISLFFSQKSASATVVTDNVNGVYTDNFSDNTGLVTRNKTGVSQGKLQLLNASNGTTTPLVSTGYAITNSIWPQILAKWGTLTFDAVTSATTSIKIQVVDGNSELFPDEFLPGNSAGFVGSSLDLSALNTLITATTSYDNYTKNNQVRFKITLSTTDGKYTPTIDNLNFTWVTKQGDLSSSTLAVSPWPTTEVDNQGTSHTPYYPDSIYPTLKWTKFLGNEKNSRTLLGKNNILYNKTSGSSYLDAPSILSNSSLRAINALTGETIWSKLITSSEEYITLAENGTIYRQDMASDNLCAFDSITQTVKWCYMFYYGHSNIRVALGNDGTIYTIRSSGDTSLTVYAFRPDGSVKWTSQVNPSVGGDTMQIWNQNIVFNGDGDLYFGYVEYGADGSPNNNGKLFIMSHVTGSVLHTINTKDAGCANIVIDKNDVAYVANGCFSYPPSNEEGRIFAINKDGTIKWTYDPHALIWWDKLSLRSDGILLARSYGYFNGAIYAFDTANGNLVWQNTGSNIELTSASRPGDFFSNGLNGFYVSTVGFKEDMSGYSAAKLYYFDAAYSQKWEITAPIDIPDGWNNYYNFIDPVMDQNGNLFVNYLNTRSNATNYIGNGNTLFSFVPWHLSLSSNLAASYYRGNTINIIAKSSMPAINPFNSEANQVQAVIDSSTKIPLTYSSTDSQGNSLWTGSYTIPQSSAIGNHNIVLEAAQSMITTDASTTFATYPSGTNNTGIKTTSTFSLILPSTPSLPAGYTAQPGQDQPKNVFNVTINNSETTTDNRTITLNLTASPDTKNIAISENQNFQFASLEPFTPTKQFQLSAGNGLKTIYVKFYTQYGFSTPTYQASIILNEKTNTFPASGLTNQPTTVDSSLPNSTTPPASGGNSTANPGQSVSIPTPAGNITANLPVGFTFQHTLQSGQTNSDIRLLQQFLTSLGSSIYPAGKITGYFGPLTRQAVIRFQERYAQEILAPQGLKHGNGRVGPATLKKINALIKK
jgi:hypothetical protein